MLDDYVDGTLPAESLALVETHLADCNRCQAEVAVLRALGADARALPRSVLPARDLWSGVEARMRAGAGAGGEAARVPRLRSAFPTFRVPALIAAAFALVLAGGVLATVYQRQTGFALEQQRYARATAELATRLAADPSHLAPDTRAVVERNLAIVDQAIHEAESALANDPGNTELEQMVLARYAQRLALLRRATDAGRRES
jgi:hypothetical protein